MAVKVALLKPVAMVRDAGTVMPVALELRLTVAPPVPLMLTVQMVELPALRA